MIDEQGLLIVEVSAFADKDCDHVARSTLTRRCASTSPDLGRGGARRFSRDWEKPVAQRTDQG